ncbi:MAG TPA: hypothetical protein VHC69_35490 [Polyangiaceae bacterium]|nr:hypothetical protein [Polyangiaceae bacterium]
MGSTGGGVSLDEPPHEGRSAARIDIASASRNSEESFVINY